MTDQRRNIVLRFGIVYIAISVLFLLVIYKIVVIQFFEKDEWMKLAERQKITDIIVKPKRGNIYASDGRLLASSIPTYHVYMDLRVPALHQDSGKLFRENIDSLSIGLSAFFKDKSAAQYKRIITDAYNKKRGQLPLYGKRISYSRLKDLRKLPLFRLGRNKSGLITKEYVRRVKPFGSLASRTIGDVYADEEKGGRSGLEGSFDAQLVGVAGVSTRQKVASRYIETVEVPPVDGLDVYSTIDIELQDIVEQALRDTIQDLQAQSGCAVLMEVKTGEIKAIVNLDRDEKNDVYYEGVNHALSDEVEPGSTFKIASLMAVLDEGKGKLSDVYDTGNGTLKIANRVMKDHNYNRGGYGPLRVDEIIQASSNVGTSMMVMHAFGDRPEDFINKLYEFGLNDSLPLQMKGIGKSWIKHPKKDKRLWYKTSLAWMSIGYEIKMPPIYTLTFYNGIANQGKMVKPLFVKSVKRNGEVVDTFRTEVLKEALCKPATLRDVQEAMLGVVQGSHATARNVKSPIVTIAGKTGTAQISQGSLGYKAGQTKHNVSFCGYFPVEDPQYSCIVVLTAPSGLPSGGRMAGSVFRKIAERTMLMKSSRTPEALAQDTMVRLPHMPSVQGGNHGAVKMVLDKLALPAGQEQGGWMKAQAASDHVLAADKFVLQKDRVPDVSGMGAKDAFYILGNLGLDVRIIGRGTVVKQSLMPGSTYKKGNVIEIVLE